MCLPALAPSCPTPSRTILKLTCWVPGTNASTFDLAVLVEAADVSGVSEINSRATDLRGHFQVDILGFWYRFFNFGPHAVQIGTSRSCLKWLMFPATEKS